MKVKLQVAERITLLSILPREGDFTSLKCVRVLRENLSFKDEEHDRLQFKYPWECPKCKFIHQVTSNVVSFVKCPDCGSGMEKTGIMRWNPEIAQETEVDISNKGFAIISEVLSNLSSQKKLKVEQFSLYEIFCVEEDEVQKEKT